MPDVFHPRQAVKDLLQGIAPSRPLFLPIVFSLGARVENVPLREFLANPTKISNSLRQVRTHLRADGVTCYFDPFLEAEALGGVLHWASDDGPPEIRWPEAAEGGRLSDGLRSPEDAAKSGRVPVAVEVIRRLKSVLRDGALLMAGVSGPFTLAALLGPPGDGAASGPTDGPPSAAEVAGATVASIARAFLEAGADVILIDERTLSAAYGEAPAEALSQLLTTVNIIRFYEALAVLLLSGCDAAGDFANEIVRRKWDCVVCPELRGTTAGYSGGVSETAAGRRGIALPAMAFDSDESAYAEFDQNLRRALRDSRPAVVTTSGDLPATASMKQLVKVSGTVMQTL
jgi:hypothetical protein